jgi:hypothetical protein
VGLENIDRQLVINLLLSVVAGGISAWCLYNRDRESRRLFEADKAWRSIKKGEEENSRLETIRRRMVIGYAVFLSLSIVWFVFFGIKVVKRLGWF